MRIGIDIVDIDRIAEVVKRTPRLLNRVFSEDELAYCLAKRNPYPSLAARFAAKEAFRKIDLSLCSGIRFHDVQVSIREGGRPELVLSAAALTKTTALGINCWEISLAHSRNQAVAAIIAYGE
ncbi:MAG TPA: holo-ACP synthase [Syntrophomonas sp.]|nr:holo-ACP synthase [Syntrophomonas sp.]